jgi:hypothetical protein
MRLEAAFEFLRPYGLGSHIHPYMQSNSIFYPSGIKQVRYTLLVRYVF